MKDQIREDDKQLEIILEKFVDIVLYHSRDIGWRTLEPSKQEAFKAISSLINKGRIEARLDELRHVFVSMDDALGSELAEPVAWEYGTVEDRIAQLSALEIPTPPSPDSKEPES